MRGGRSMNINRTDLYSHQMRILSCPGCGAPVPAALGAGRASCEYCRAPIQFEARNEKKDLQRAAASAQLNLSESERLAKLREQEKIPESRPAAIQDVVRSGDVNALEQGWLRARNAVVAQSDVVQQEKLFYLTRQLVAHHDEDRRRAILETASELVEDARFRHVLHCDLAVGAIRFGDFAGAEGWLALAEPRPLDLMMDSALRCARALMAIRQQDWAKAQSFVGATAAEVPIATDFKAAAAVIRFQVHIALTRPQEILTATEMLLDAHGWERVFVVVDTYQPLLPIVNGAMTELASSTYEKKKKIEARNKMILRVGIALGAVAVLGLVAVTVIAAASGMRDWHMIPYVGFVGVASLGGTVAPFALIAWQYSTMARMWGATPRPKLTAKSAERLVHRTRARAHLLNPASGQPWRPLRDYPAWLFERRRGNAFGWHAPPVRGQGVGWR